MRKQNKRPPLWGGRLFCCLAAVSRAGVQVVTIIGLIVTFAVERVVPKIIRYHVAVVIKPQSIDEQIYDAPDGNEDHKGRDAVQGQPSRAFLRVLIASTVDEIFKSVPNKKEKRERE